ARQESRRSDCNPPACRDLGGWFESTSLQRRVRCEPVSRGNSPSYVEKPGFSAGVRRSVGGAVGGDAQGGAISHQGTAISLSGLIPVPQCRRPVLTTVTKPAQSKTGCLGTCRCRLGVEPGAGLT